MLCLTVSGVHVFRQRKLFHVNLMSSALEKIRKILFPSYTSASLTDYRQTHLGSRGGGGGGGWIASKIN